DHAVGLDARDDSLAEGSVDHVLAEPERDGGLLIARAGCLPRRRATSGAAAGPEPACVAPDRRRAEPGRLHLRLVEKLGRYLVEEATAHAAALGAVDRAAQGMCEAVLVLRAGHDYVVTAPRIL